MMTQTATLFNGVLCDISALTRYSLSEFTQHTLLVG
jgi:hypothetical protein